MLATRTTHMWHFMRMDMAASAAQLFDIRVSPPVALQ